MMATKKKHKRPNPHSLYTVRMVWTTGHESNIVVRAASSKGARTKAREMALHRTTTPPHRVTVRKLHVF
jgi:hypothetical protein